MFKWLKPLWDRLRGKSGDDWLADDTEFPTSGLENLEPGEPRVPSDPGLFPHPEPSSLMSEFSEIPEIPTFRHLPASKEPTEQKKAVSMAAWERSAARKRRLGKPVPPPPVFEEKWHIEAPGPPGDVFPVSPLLPVPIATRSGAPGGSPFPELPGLPTSAAPAGLQQQGERQGGSLQPLPGAGVRVENEDGSFSSERTIGVNIDDREYVIPTLLGGKQASVEEAIKAAKAHGLDKFPSFDTPEQASAYAEQRTNQLGAQDATAPVKAPDVAPAPPIGADVTAPPVGFPAGACRLPLDPFPCSCLLWWLGLMSGRSRAHRVIR